MLQWVLANSELPEDIQRGMADAAMSKNEIEALLETYTAVVWIEGHGADKYGRVLVTVRSAPDYASFSHMLIQERLGYVYEGEKRLTEAEQVLRLLQ